MQFNFKLSGGLRYGLNRPGSPRLNRPSLHIRRKPPGIAMMEWTAPSAHGQLVAVSLRPKFIVEQLLPAQDHVPTRLRGFVSAPEEQVHCCRLPLTTQIMDITTRLINNPFSSVGLSTSPDLLGDLRTSGNFGKWPR